MGETEKEKKKSLDLYELKSKYPFHSLGFLGIEPSITFTGVDKFDDFSF